MSAPAGKDQTATAVNGVTPAPAPVDLYRDTPVRYLGYANEVGEAGSRDLWSGHSVRHG